MPGGELQGQVGGQTRVRPPTVQMEPVGPVGLGQAQLQSQVGWRPEAGF